MVWSASYCSPTASRVSHSSVLDLSHSSQMQTTSLAPLTIITRLCLSLIDNVKDILIWYWIINIKSSLPWFLSELYIYHSFLLLLFLAENIYINFQSQSLHVDFSLNPFGLFCICLVIFLFLFSTFLLVYAYKWPFSVLIQFHSSNTLLEIFSSLAF